MQKIIFINIFQGQEGGGEVYLRRLIDVISKENLFKIYLLTPPTEGGLIENLDNNIEVNPITGIAKTSFKSNIGRFFATIRDVNRIIKNVIPDIIVINGERAIYMAPFLKTKASVVGVRHMLIDSRAKKKLASLSFKHCDKIVTISQFHKKNFVQYLGLAVESKIEVIYNAVDTKKYSYTPAIKNDTIRFIQIGTLESRKGAMDTLLVFKQIVDERKFTNVELVLVGRGEDEILLRNFIKSNSLENVVSLLGFRNDIAKLIGESDILLLPSYNEGLPLSILEAFAIGRPVITSNVAGIPELVDHENNGFMISPGDLVLYKKFVEYFLLNFQEIEIMGNNGRRKVELLFTQEQWIKNWKDLLIHL